MKDWEKIKLIIDSKMLIKYPFSAPRYLGMMKKFESIAISRNEDK